MYSMALALMAKAALVYYNGNPPQKAENRKLYDLLVAPNKALVEIFNHTLYPHIDADLAAVFYHRAHELDFWALFKPIFTSQDYPRGSNTLAICKDTLAFVCSVAWLFPEETWISAGNYLECATGLLRGNDALCDYFWGVERHQPQFRALLDFSRTKYPATPHLLPNLLKALTGTRQVLRVARYFSSLISLTQAFSPLVSENVDSVLDPISDVIILEANAPIQMHPSPRKTMFAIPPTTRGLLSTHANGNEYVIWSVKYNGWDLLLCLIDNLLCEDDPLDLAHSEALASIQCSLELLKEVLFISPVKVRDLFTCQPAHYNEGSDLRLVYQLIDLCDACICSRDPPKGIFSTTLAILSVLFPLYPVVVGNFLGRVSLFFTGASLDCNTLSRVILTNKSGHDAFPILKASLELSVSCAIFLVDKLSFQGQIYYHSESIPQFVLTALRTTLVDVYPHYLFWSYSSLVQKYQIGTHCFDLYILVLEASDSDKPVLQDMTNLVTEAFFQHENSYMLKPMMDVVMLGREWLKQHERSGQKLEASMVAELIYKALQLLTLLLKKKFAHANHSGLARHWVMGMLEDRNGYSCDFVHHIIKYVTTNNSHLIAKSAVEVVSLLVTLGSSNPVASQKLGLTFSIMTQEFGKEVCTILSDDAVHENLKLNTWNLLSCLANAHSHYLEVLLGLDTSIPSLLTPVIEVALKQTYNQFELKDASPVDCGFFCFLKTLWKNHVFYRKVLESFRFRAQLWEDMQLLLADFSDPYVACMQMNIHEIIGYEIDRLTGSAELAMASNGFKILVAKSLERFPSILRTGLKLMPRPQSLQLLNRTSTAKNISVASMEKDIDLAAIKDLGIGRISTLVIDANKVARSMHLMSYGQGTWMNEDIFWCIKEANYDIIHAHIHRLNFHESTKLVKKIFSCPIEAAFDTKHSKLEAIRTLLQQLVDYTNRHAPSKNNLAGIASLAHLMAEIACTVYEMKDQFKSVPSAKLLMDLLTALISCSRRVTFSRTEDGFDHTSLITHLKMGWYQAISGTLMTLESVKAFWMDNAECKDSFHCAFKTAVELGFQDLLLAGAVEGSFLVSFQAKIVGMLVSLFHINEVPDSDGWIEDMEYSYFDEVLMKLMMDSVAIDSVDAQLFCHKTLQLMAHICSIAVIGRTIASKGIIPKITSLLTQKKILPAIFHSTTDSAIAQTHVFMACLDLCAQLYKCDHMDYSNRKVANQTDKFFEEVAPIVRNIMCSVTDPVQHSFTQLRCIGASVTFVTSVNYIVLPTLAYGSWKSSFVCLSPLLNFMADTLHLPGGLARRFINPSPIEAQLAQRFALTKVNPDSLPRFFVDQIVLQVLGHFNSIGDSREIVKDNSARSTLSVVLLAECHRTLGREMSFGSLLDIILIYTPELDWATQALEKYFTPRKDDKIPLELIARVQTASSILARSIILLLAQTHLLLTSVRFPTELKSNLLYDIQQDISNQFTISSPTLKKLIDWFPKRPTSQGQSLAQTLETLVFYWRKVRQHIASGSHQLTLC
ncbi:hypothetical protein DSO57_1017548 [Entomophthora muscae]|uniref:Uncharacterized protein n=1 Tax=Entomophthora muscae TaxID=34485 RepID=A0ACC2STA0_9FUNG|nr:hypothetical protein DSO57_1017548 [Entomophthora muscae]